MGIIRILPKEISNLIAAGEVVDRPASVVKELIENSVDAGASFITTEIGEGGAGLIRVSDDGCGMSPEDAEAAFVRHATSKIGSAADLDDIRTMGFRGEALAAIASVARVELVTKTRETDAGTKIIVEGGEIIEIIEIGAPAGTSITIRDLFYNTPARREFLKRESTEAAACQSVADRAAMANPCVSIRFVKDGRETLLTAGDGDLRTVIRQIYGPEMEKSLLSVDGSGGLISVTGFVGGSSYTRPNRNMQLFFVNGRPVRSPIMGGALSEAYRHSVPTGRHPVCVLGISLPPGSVDVNVHPTKSEIRFSDEKAVYEAVFSAVTEALSKADGFSGLVIPERSAGGKSRGILSADGRRNLIDVDPRVWGYSPAKPSAGGHADLSDLERAPLGEAISETGTSGGAPLLNGENAQHLDPKGDLPDPFGGETGRKPESDATASGGKPGESHLKGGEASGFAGDRPGTESGSSIPELTNMPGEIKPESFDPSLLQKKAEHPEGRFRIAGVETAELSGYSDLSDPGTPYAAGMRTSLGISGREPAGPPDLGRFEPGESGAAPIAIQTELPQMIKSSASVLVDPPIVEIGLGWRIAGEVFGTYILVETVDELLVIDKHAAHERMIYEELKNSGPEGSIQQLITPVPATLTREEHAALLENAEMLLEMGFYIEDFGGGSVIVRGIPLVLSSGDPADLAAEIAGSILELRRERSPSLYDELLISLACKAAVKGGSPSGMPENYELVATMLALSDLKHCPHGRPVALSLERGYLEGRFERR